MRLLPLLIAGGFAAAGAWLPRTPSLSLRGAIAAAVVALVCWYLVLLRSGLPLRVEVAIRKQHWIQLLAHSSIFLYWSTQWPLVATWAPLILTQLLFAYGVEMLLAWSRGRTYGLGFGPFPIIGSINLFLWFKPEWFALQLGMVATAILTKEFITWEQDGRRAHVFNPSAFPLAVASLGLLATGSTGITWGYDVATLLDVPYMYALIVLVSLPGQVLFGVTTMTMSAGVTMYLFSLCYYATTGTYYFPDTLIPIAVFLGMHLLFTDPSTSPRTDAGRVLFGVLYAASVILLFAVLEAAGMPSFYDKLLAVPFLNLARHGIDRLTSRFLRWPKAAMLAPALEGRRKNLAMASLWCCGCIAVSVVHVNMPRANGTTDLHAAAVEDRVTAVRLLLLAGADPNAVDGSGKTPLSLAAMNGNGVILRALVNAGGRANASTADGLTLLMLAARSSTEATEALIDGGAAVNVQDPLAGGTALMWSVRAGHAETARALIRAGADVQARNREGETALAMALAAGDDALVLVLRDGGAHDTVVTRQDREGGR